MKTNRRWIPCFISNLRYIPSSFIYYIYVTSCLECWICVMKIKAYDLLNFHWIFWRHYSPLKHLISPTSSIKNGEIKFLDIQSGNCVSRHVVWRAYNSGSALPKLGLGTAYEKDGLNGLSSSLKLGLGMAYKKDGLNGSSLSKVIIIEFLFEHSTIWWSICVMFIYVELTQYAR